MVRNTKMKKRKRKVQEKRREQDVMDVGRKEALKRKVNKEQHLKIHGGLREGIRMKTYLHGSMDPEKKLRV